MNRVRIVVVEDEAVIREAITEVLVHAGHEVATAADGEQGVALATGQDVGLVLLDLMLPRLDGLSALARIRRLRPQLPVIILTAKGSEEDVVRGLQAGADDYVVKPFGARELLARLEAVLRRSPSRPEPVPTLTLGERRVDFSRREVTDPSGQITTLTEAEAALLSHLAENPGRAVAREELQARLWGMFGSRVESRAVDMHIARLRHKLGDDGARPAIVLTVRGKGYMLGGPPR